MRVVPCGRCVGCVLVSAFLGSSAACGPRSAGTAGRGGGTSGGTGAAGGTGTGASVGATSRGTGSDTGAATTGGPAFPCASDEDCRVVDDCCTCDVFHVDAPVPVCPDPCFAPLCEGQGWFDPKAVCIGGVCRFAEVSCNPSLVACDAPSPACPPGWLPSVEGICWGPCVPASACDTVPDCSICTREEVCVRTVDLSGAVPDCEPVPVGCDLGDLCACMPPLCPNHLECNQDGPAAVACSCTDC